MKQQYWVLIIICVCLGMPWAAAAETSTAPQGEAPSLDERAQALKNDIKTLNRDLLILEEELLFPAVAQLAVFLAFDAAESFSLDSIQLKIDGKVIADHLYTRDELEALRRGGVQRLYLGNLKSGKHELEASFSGPVVTQGIFQHVMTFPFEKAKGAKYLQLKIVDADKNQQPEIVFREWE